MAWKLCRYCGCPMLPKGRKKKPGEFDHAQGCPYSRRRPKPSNPEAGKENTKWMTPRRWTI